MIVVNDVKISGIQPEAVLAMVVADGIFRHMALPCVITSVTGGKHMKGSLHPRGLAFDIRTRSLSNTNKVFLLSELTNSLPNDFDIVDENDHIHVEFDPKL